MECVVRVVLFREVSLDGVFHGIGATLVFDVELLSMK